ncbi:MAG: SAM-dependent DNA methyltransferase [Burkholderiales bacterium]|nr:SAM-dependent DNA methyltransferase [Burkholderiales bacterium]
MPVKKSVSREHRRTLENTVAAARIDAEAGAEKALQALAVGAAALPTHLSPAQRALRVRLREHARQLGDPRSADKTQATDRLLVEVAYEHWHRMLFARFLAEAELLMHPDGYPVTLADCKEDAATLVPPVGSHTPSEWEVAGRYASAMLPNVFRTDSPALALELPLESQQALERRLASLPAEVFEADDSLGWSYQFWQAPRKEAVQRQMKNAGTKVGADELPAVTQLFTEPYMVAFLLENALGAWWHRAHAGKPLPVAMPYLRMTADGTPAAGPMAGWPQTLAEFRVLDPALGSGHFLVSALHMLVPLRMAAEGLSARQAVDRVLTENLHGLELDARCVEIAAFALALAAWRYPAEDGSALGVRPLPRLNIACCGLAPQTRRADWLALAAGDARLEAGMGTFYELFQKAPELGSLLDPSSTAAKGGLFDARWDELATLLDAALVADAVASGGNDLTEAGAAKHEAAIAAQGMAVATRLLSQRYHWVMTNPPYLGSGQHGPVLKEFCESHYSVAKNDLANVFLERCLRLCKQHGVVQFVMPQNWLLQATGRPQREYLLRHETWNFLARLGPGAFETITGEVVKAILLTLTRSTPNAGQAFYGVDATSADSPLAKADLLRTGALQVATQVKLLENPASVVSFEDLSLAFPRTAKFFESYQGLVTGDIARFTACFWEVANENRSWVYLKAPSASKDDQGRTDVLLWEGGTGALHEYARLTRDQLHDMHESGNLAWTRHGVSINRVKNLRASVYGGEAFHNSVAVVVPQKGHESLLPALLAFSESEDFVAEVRKLDEKLSLTNRVLLQLPFDEHRWRREAETRYPRGLPKPYSDDLTQWVFHCHPRPSTDPLQVAVARLLGFRWPAERDPKMELSDEARAWVSRCAELDPLCDEDGIVCLPPVRGEAVAVDRLRALLARAFGVDWSAAREAALLREAGCEGLPLAQWLRDKFFAQHVARFQKRPFIWHVWDGHKEGFSALVNVHTLTRAKLQTLIHTYLGDWITQQKRAVDAGDGDATLRLARAQALNEKLEAILEGEAPYDIFVRWKPAHLQPIGWEPDLNDGVRMNIRPFVQAEVLRIPGRQLGIKWEPDRGKDVPSAPWFKLGPTYGEPEGTRINDHHLSLADKQAARAKVSEGKKP